jgi:cytochrome P450
MQLATELALPDMPFENPDFANDPLPYLEAARKEHGWLARCSVGYLIHEHQAIKDVIYMDDVLRTSNDSVTEIMGAKGTRWGGFIENQILAQSGAEHTRLRASVAASFTPRNIARYRPLMRDVAARLLDEWVPKGGFDFAEFASYFPIAVTCGMVGAPRDSIRPIRDSFETQGLAFSLDRSLMPAMEAAFGVIWEFVDRLIREREKTGGGDSEEVLNTLIAARDAGQINELELRYLLIFIFAAGYDTSKNMLTLLMYTMLGHPDYWERCARDREFCDRAVEEQFRYASVSSPYRTVAKEFVYRGVKFPEGSLLVFVLPLAGRDPSAFARPSTFDPDREHINRHVAFGRGMHMCLGQHLAKAQIEEGAHLIAQRITRPKLAGKISWRPFPGVWGLRTLPIRFEIRSE